MFVKLATWTDMTVKTQASLAQRNPAYFCATHMICCAVVTSSQRAHGQPCLNHQRGLWHCIVRFIFHSTALVQSNQNLYSKNRGREKKPSLWIQGTVRKIHKERDPFVSEKFCAWYQKESHLVFVWWWEHGVLSVTQGKSEGVSFRPSFKLDVSPSLCTQQTAEVTQMRFFLLRSATCPDETRRFQLPSSLSHTDPRKSGRMPTGEHIWTWQPHPTIPQDGIIPFFPPNHVSRYHESKQIKIIRLHMSTKNWLHVI